MESESKMQVYEVAYILVPSIAEEHVGAEVTALKDMFGKFGAAFVSDEYPKMMELAYEMSRTIANKKQKFSTGYFGWVKFEMTPENIIQVKTALDTNESLIRFIIVKTVRESTLSPKRTYSKETRRKTTKDDTAEPEKIDEETIDKDIEALVVE